MGNNRSVFLKGVGVGNLVMTFKYVDINAHSLVHYRHVIANVVFGVCLHVFVFGLGAVSMRLVTSTVTVNLQNGQL